MKGVTKRTDMYFPESRGSQHKKTTGVLAEDIPVPPPKVLLLVKPDGSYALEAGGKLPFSISTFESSESRDGCSAKEETSQHTDEPVAGGKQRRRMVVDGKCLLDVQYARTGAVLTLSVSHRGQVTTNQQSGKAQIAGKLPLMSRHDIGEPQDFPCWKLEGAHITGQSYSEDLMADWEFELYSPCSDVKEAFLNDWALYQAYTNDGLLKAAEQAGMSGKEYEDLVGRSAAGSRNDEGGGHREAVDELGTTADCETPDEQDFIDQRHKECVPQVIIDATLAHEKTHREQCQADRKRYRKAGPAEYHDYDGEAYAVGVRILLGWLEKHCPDFNAQPYRAALSRSSGQ